jgi:hypothetical protein
MKAIAIDAGDGCVAPTAETISDGTYPFSRSLYIYVSTTAMAENPAIESFVDLYLSEEGIATVTDAGTSPCPTSARARRPRRGPPPRADAHQPLPTMWPDRAQRSGRTVGALGREPMTHLSRHPACSR